MKSTCFSSALLALCLLFCQTLPAQDIAYLQICDGYWQVWVMAEDGSQARQVTFSRGDKTRASWYPDGYHLLINHANGTLARVNIASGKESSVHTPLAGMLDAVLSPDGSHIALSLSTGDSIDNNNLWLIDIEQREKARLLTRMPRLQHEPSWSADSQYLYFLSGQGGQSHDIWRARIADGSTEQLTVNTLYHFDIAISHTGVRAFSSNRSGNYELWQWPEQGEPRQLTHHPALDARPSWSPDGQSLVFESTRNNQLAIWKLNLANGELVQLSSAHAAARYPVWRQGENLE